MKYLFFPLLILYFSISVSLSAQNATKSSFIPLWLRLDRAIQKVDSGESGEAVYLFRKILEDNNYKNNPEAEMWLGLIFDKENEYDISIKYLELALEHKKQLLILEDQYLILYKLADINRKIGKMSSYTEYLNKIIQYSQEGPNSALESSMLKIIEQRKYDKFIELYRPTGKISLRAYGQLGRFYFQSGNWKDSIKYLMQVTGTIISTSIDEIKKNNPEYTYLVNSESVGKSETVTDKSLENVLNIVNNNSKLKKYFADNSFYEYFYYLGKALVNSGFKESGAYILEKIYVRPESGKWGELSNPG